MQGPPPNPWEQHAPGPQRRSRPQEPREHARRVPRQRRAPEDHYPNRQAPPGYDGSPGWQAQPGYDPHAGYDPHPGWHGQPGYDPHAGWEGQPGYQAAAGREPQPGWDGYAEQGWSGAGAPDNAGGRVYGGRAGVGDPPARAPAGRRARAPRWALLTTIFGAILMVFSGGTALAGVILMDRYAGSVQQEDLLGAAAVDPGEALDGPINVLLLGLDGRQEGTDDTRSDTIIVLHVPSTHDQAYLISVPRDTWVTVPGYWDMKITEAFYHGNKDGGWNGGARLVAAALHDLTGLQFNAAAIVNFNGFETIIDEMGGIEFCVETAASSEHLVIANGQRMSIGQARRQGLHFERARYEVGCQHLEGWQALDYVRQRKNLETHEGDYARQRHQQQLLQAMASQATSRDVMTNVGTMDRLLRATGDALIIDTNQASLADFAFTMRHIRPNDMISLRTNEGWYNPAQINGISAEVLTEQSKAMFRAAANDTMAQFVINNPDSMNTD